VTGFQGDGGQLEQRIAPAVQAAGAALRSVQQLGKDNFMSTQHSGTINQVYDNRNEPGKKPHMAVYIDKQRYGVWDSALWPMCNEGAHITFGWEEKAGKDGKTYYNIVSIEGAGATGAPQGAPQAASQPAQTPPAQPPTQSAAPNNKDAQIARAVALKAAVETCVEGLHTVEAIIGLAKVYELYLMGGEQTGIEADIKRGIEKIFRDEREVYDFKQKWSLDDNCHSSEPDMDGAVSELKFLCKKQSATQPPPTQPPPTQPPPPKYGGSDLPF